MLLLRRSLFTKQDSVSHDSGHWVKSENPQLNVGSLGSRVCMYIIKLVGPGLSEAYECVMDFIGPLSLKTF